MAPQSSTLAWKIPWMEEPGRLQSMGWLRVGHDSVTSLSLFTFMHWRRKWQPTPVFLLGESQGWRSLVGCRLWDHTESDHISVTYYHSWRFYLLAVTLSVTTPTIILGNFIIHMDDASNTLKVHFFDFFFPNVFIFHPVLSPYSHGYTQDLIRTKKVTTP